MGVDYNFALRVGFEVSEKEIKKAFQKEKVEHIDGIFHFEDRFDPKTGKKLDPIKVWDKKPKTKRETWFQVGENKSGGECEFDDYYPDSLCEFISDCIDDVSFNIEYHYNDDGLSFFVFSHNHGKCDNDWGSISVTNKSMPYTEVVRMAPKLQKIKEKFAELGLDLGETKVCIAENIY